MIPSSVKEIGNDIRSMKIRGAGLIARTACKGLLESVKHSKAESSNEFYQEILQVAKYLNETRPSAVSLPNGLRFVLKRLRTVREREDSLNILKETVVQAAQKFIKNSEAAVEKIGEIGARRIRDGDVLMTICNSSAAISVLSTAASQGKSITC
ncbi:MAG: ribose 1,5-bisphosphate isomerase, partial [Candidatus Heimdallarchaeota archaeon]|nr:ribose 1,5-bisphosphate isomerase [Candidatus Heimdallarchaeota archaeon]